MAQATSHLRRTSFGRALAAGALALLLAACASRAALEARHSPSRAALPTPQADFAAYAAQTKAQIAVVNRAIDHELDSQVIEDRAPFELAPDPERCPHIVDGRHQRAALLIHGLGETPYAMRALGERFAAACYLVRAILLPGHGTVPGICSTWATVTGSRRRERARRASRASPSASTSSASRRPHARAGLNALGPPSPSAPALGGLVLLAPALASRSSRRPLARDHLAQGALMPAGGFSQLAHPALPIAPDDRRYGMAADYLDCEHYYWETDTPNWLICADSRYTPANSPIRYGEITGPNLAAHVVRRLTYNPDFDALVARILAFLAQAPWPTPPLPELKPGSP